MRRTQDTKGNAASAFTAVFCQSQPRTLHHSWRSSRSFPQQHHTSLQPRRSRRRVRSPSSSVQITSSGSSRLPATQSGTLRLARDKGTIRTVVQSDPADTPTIIRRTPHAADARCAPGARNSLRQIPTSHIATLAHSTLRPAYKHRFTPLTYCALALMAGC